MDKNTRVTVHLSNDNVFEDVVLFGFTQAGNIKQAFPYELSGMRILEHPDGSKFRTPIPHETNWHNKTVVDKRLHALNRHVPLYNAGFSDKEGVRRELKTLAAVGLGTGGLPGVPPRYCVKPHGLLPLFSCPQRVAFAGVASKVLVTISPNPSKRVSGSQDAATVQITLAFEGGFLRLLREDTRKPGYFIEFSQ